MNWLKSFFGLYDRKQAKRTEEVAKYVAEKKETFTKDMSKLEYQAKILHNESKKAHMKSIKINDVVDDITAKIAVAAGSYKLVKND